MKKTCFRFVLTEVFEEEVGGNAEGKVSHGIFLQCTRKKLEIAENTESRTQLSIHSKN